MDKLAYASQATKMLSRTKSERPLQEKKVEEE